MSKEEPLYTLLKIINILPNRKEDLIDITIEQDIMKSPAIISQYYKLIPELKKYYNSEMLTCLHKNSLKKQKFPAINMLRQILKCNNLKLKPYSTSNGYDKSNGKKIVRRFYIITSIDNE